ncbi:MAG: hypothetical protein IPF99_38315 [Deltaproteobacteria bacterium]|nr:hypothetical protein [Deltaproteobacteria bacterium]
MLPNTLRAKVPDRAFGFRYLLGWSTLAGGLVLVALGALPSMSRAARALLSLVALHTLAVVLEGGDWMFGHRLLLPSLPCLAMALDAPLADLLPPPRWRLSRAAALAALAALALWTAQNLRAGALIRDSNELLGAQDVSRASLARELLSRGARSAALYDIGVFGYAVPTMRIADLGGLTDRELASRPGGLGRKRVDDSWLRTRDPDVVLANALPVALPNRPEPRLRVQWPVERRLLALPSFAERYVPECVASVGGHYLLLVYRRRDRYLAPPSPGARRIQEGRAPRRRRFRRLTGEELGHPIGLADASPPGRLRAPLRGQLRGRAWRLHHYVVIAHRISLDLHLAALPGAQHARWKWMHPDELRADRRCTPTPAPTSPG